MNAKTVVSPTNVQPRFFKSLDSATEAGEMDVVDDGLDLAPVADDPRILEEPVHIGRRRGR